VEGGGGWYQWEGEKWWGKEIGGWIWCKKCICIYVNGKSIHAETIPGIEGGGYKESSGGGEFKYDIFDTL
jgi:hypothetical protein